MIYHLLRHLVCLHSAHICSCSHTAVGDLKLDNLWMAVSMLQGIRNCSSATRIGLVNLLELIWGSEEQNDETST
jgi:hypothetical protein